MKFPVLLAVLGVLMWQTPAGAHDHQPPRTVLHAGKERQRGLLTFSMWFAPTEEGECVPAETRRPVAYPQPVTRKAGKEVFIRVFKTGNARTRASNLSPAPPPPSYGTTLYVKRPGRQWKRLRGMTESAYIDGGAWVAEDLRFTPRFLGHYHFRLDMDWMDTDCEAGLQQATWRFNLRVA